MFIAVLMRSKTSGPGKRNKQLPVAVLADAGLRGVPWMQAWWDLGRVLWKDEKISFLLPRAPGVPGSCIALMANYPDVSAGAQKHFAAMTWPVWAPHTGWKSSDVPMHSEFMS